MKAKIFTFALFLYLLNFLHMSVLDHVKVLGVKPDLIIVSVVSVALMRGPWSGLVFALFAGIFHDLAASRFMGIHTILCLMIALVIGLLHQRVYKENYLILIFLTLTATIFYKSAYFFLVFAIPAQAHFSYAFSNIILPESLYNALASILIYNVIRLIYRKFDYVDNVHTRL